MRLALCHSFHRAGPLYKPDGYPTAGCASAKLYCIIKCCSRAVYRAHSNCCQFSAVVWSALIFTAVLATAYANLVQTGVQKVLPPTTASILFTSESLFGGFFGWLLLHETLGLRQSLGAMLLIICMIGAVLTSSSKEKQVISENPQIGEQ